MSNDKKLNENEHILTTPELIGTDQEKIAGIKFWADVIALIRTINTTFVSYENRKAVIDAFTKELELIGLEGENAPAQVTQPGPDTQDGKEIPSADQLPSNEQPEVNVVDLTKNGDVANTTVANVPPRPPTFENLDKLRRVAGSGIWDKNYGPVGKVKK